MIISLLVAMDENRLIGADGALPWRLPDDMKWFRQRSMGKPVIMGRKTYESIPDKFRPLPGRHNIVLTRNTDYVAPGATVVHDATAALAAAGDVAEVVIGGGTAVYATFFPVANRLYLTQVNRRFSGDAYFPIFNREDWQQTFHEHHPADERHSVSFDWTILERPNVTPDT